MTQAPEPQFQPPPPGPPQPPHAAPYVAKPSRLLEEFIAREAQCGRFALSLQPATEPLLVHGHCHQKAFAADPGSMVALQDITQAKELIEQKQKGLVPPGEKPMTSAEKAQKDSMELIQSMRPVPELKPPVPI